MSARAEISQAEAIVRVALKRRLTAEGIDFEKDWTTDRLVAHAHRHLPTAFFHAGVVGTPPLMNEHCRDEIREILSRFAWGVQVTGYEVGFFLNDAKCCRLAGD